MIRGMKRNLGPYPSKRFDVGASIHNRFDIEVVDAISGEVKQKAFAENTICAKLWTYLCSNSAWNNYIHYGKGQGTPSASDTSLFAFVGSVASTLHSESFDPDANVYKLTKKAVLSETTAVGITITEVGIGQGTGSSSLLTHALLRDMNGNAISLEKSDTDVLNIYATVFCHLILPTNCFVTGFRYNQDGAIKSSILAHLVGQTTLDSIYLSKTKGYSQHLAALVSANKNFDVSSKTITFAATRLGVSDWNIGGIKCFYLGTASSAEIICEVEDGNGWYEKTTVVGESVGTGDGVTLDFKTDFPFAKNATVYIDGVAVEAEVEYGYSVQNLGYYMRLLRADTLGIYSGSYGNTTGPVFGVDDSGIFRFTGNNVNNPIVLENALWETHPVTKMTLSGGTVRASNNLVDWVDVTLGVELTEAYRYWELTRGYGRSMATFESSVELPSANNIHFAAPPAEGAVITADYDAVCVAKDENHVFDLSIVFKFNEYNEG